jgi:hypothetical protein
MLLCSLEHSHWFRRRVPPDIVGDIGAQAAALVRKNLAIAAEALRLQRLFDDADLPILFVKDAALAVLAFGNLGLRSGQDIDLLVPYATLPAATALISPVGYRRFDPPREISDSQLRLLMPLRKDLGFVHQATGERIELHWRLFLNPHAMAEASMIGASRVVPLTGSGRLRTLGEEDLFAYLSMHGALHWWYRYQRAAGGHLGGQRGAPHPRRRSSGRGARRRPGPRTLPAASGDAPPRPTDGHARQKRYGALAGGDGAERDDHRPRRTRTARRALWDGPRQPLDLFLSRSWRYRLAELNVHLTNQTDVLTLPLPERLRFLYPVLRLPLWAWRHAAKQSVRQ